MMTSNSPTFSKSSSAERFWQGYSHSLDEIRDDLNLDEMQALSDDYYWTEDSDIETLYPNVSQDYLDFLLSYE